MYHAVTKVEGKCDIDVIRREVLERIVDVKDSDGIPLYPKMKMQLTTCCYHYAWKKIANFNIEHQILYKQRQQYRGRLITDDNIQEYLSDIIKKYLIKNTSPWQLIIIPIYNKNHYYILLRVYNILLDEYPNLTIGKLLQIDKDYIKKEHSSKTYDNFSMKKKINYIKKLINFLQILLRKLWLYYQNNYDIIIFNSNNNTITLKAINNIFHLFIILIIIIIKVIIKRFIMRRKLFKLLFNPIYEVKLFLKYFLIELSKRNITKATVNILLGNFLNNLQLSIVIRKVIFFLMISMPNFFVSELDALRHLIANDRQVLKQNTIIGVTGKYLPLFVKITKELIIFTWLIIESPKTIYEILIENKNKCTNTLQNASLIGRRVVSWSNAINLNDLQNLSKAKGLNETEVLLSATISCLKDFFEFHQTDNETPPNELLLIYRSLNQEFLLNNQNYNDSIDGDFYFKLNLLDTCQQQIKNIKTNTKNISNKQLILYLLQKFNNNEKLLIKLFPIIWLKILHNYITKNYSVTITEMLTNYNYLNVKTVWGDEVVDVLYFHQPTANTALSLTFQRFGNHVRLGLMGDVQLRPMHKRITENWTQFLQSISLKL